MLPNPERLTRCLKWKYDTLLIKSMAEDVAIKKEHLRRCKVSCSTSQPYEAPLRMMADSVFCSSKYKKVIDRVTQSTRAALHGNP
mmetsp:Transcript_117943/g.214477  ORF Transcript_117943/g.214477 Transcript_117943/m.214477 type:complete len:85 (-) Transcript_117943:191-445(-)